METKRIFIAINLKEEIREYLSAIKNNLTFGESKIKWVEKENLHLTLKFIGDTNQQLLELINIKLKEITSQYNTFIIKLSPDIGLFPLSAKKINIIPRVIWVGIEEKNNILKNFFNSMEEGLSEIGIPKENKGFSSHITLGRIKYLKDKRRLINLINSITIQNYSQKIESIELMESKLTPKGPYYSILHQYPLLK